jgi:hypothetical protein
LCSATNAILTIEKTKSSEFCASQQGRAIAFDATVFKPANQAGKARQHPGPANCAIRGRTWRTPLKSRLAAGTRHQNLCNEKLKQTPIAALSNFSGLRLSVLPA